MSFSKLYLSLLLEVLEVPANERVVVLVSIRGDEGSTPVNLIKRHTHKATTNKYVHCASN